MSDAGAEVSMETLPFVVSIDEEDLDGAGGSKSILGRRDGDVSIRHIPVAVLRENLQRVVDAIRGVFDDVADGGGRMPLKQATVSVEVTAGGGITVVGTSAQVAGRGAITLTFGE